MDQLTQTKFKIEALSSGSTDIEFISKETDNFIVAKKKNTNRSRNVRCNYY